MIGGTGADIFAVEYQLETTVVWDFDVGTDAIWAETHIQIGRFTSGDISYHIQTGYNDNLGLTGTTLLADYVYSGSVVPPPETRPVAFLASVEVASLDQLHFTTLYQYNF